MILDHFALSHICDNCPERVKPIHGLISAFFPVVRLFRTSRCHREFGTPSFRHPHSKYPSVFGTGVQNSLRVFGIPPCTPQGILHPPLRKRMYQRAHHVPARACTEVVNRRAKSSRRAHEPSRYSIVQSELGCNSQPIGEGVLYQMDRVSLGVRFRSYKAVSWT